MQGNARAIYEECGHFPQINVVYKGHFVLCILMSSLCSFSFCVVFYRSAAYDEQWISTTKTKNHQITIIAFYLWPLVFHIHTQIIGAVTEVHKFGLCATYDHCCGYSWSAVEWTALMTVVVISFGDKWPTAKLVNLTNIEITECIMKIHVKLV
jgi:hypothetical protein